MKPMDCAKCFWYHSCDSVQGADGCHRRGEYIAAQVASQKKGLFSRLAEFFCGLFS